ncbi:hypothetical protein L202_03919 [Cryptococcus amylolentus CBS 6039]|uniref:CWH43-like N-terminal domain-containing protein n=2 Tax=Cryptococcus amylolentus TaxID=104669 RepID=A0A1E3HS46_9TREE|nr:hypothetical protein L202_03919 [Cryptococcus amylolentus CBS 6039]ODN78271.1 hypothetical protein L202_03919 [Cryptococcus amylolentus CBS 6039]ODO07127.1 hypothetical protein I350_04497 [Cryptococcus amylolentus CBS 6273]
MDRTPLPSPLVEDELRSVTAVNSRNWYRIFILLPIGATLVWLSGLTALLALWISQGRPRYDNNVASVALISDVGGQNETLFLCICILTDILYFSSVCAIRWLRHKGRLPEHIGRWENIFGWLAVVFCMLGCSGLFILAKWNAYQHSVLHWNGTMIFIIGVGASAFCQTVEVWLLRRGHRERKHLPRNAYWKLAIVIIDVVLACVFGASYLYCGGTAHASNGHTAAQCNTTKTNAGILEWTIAYGLNIYFLTLVADLWPVGNRAKWGRGGGGWVEMGAGTGIGLRTDTDMEIGEMGGMGKGYGAREGKGKGGLTEMEEVEQSMLRY